MSPHKEAHRYDFEDHFNSVNQQKYQVDLVSHSGDAIDLLVNGQEEAVCEYDAKDDPIEPRIDRHHLDDLVPDRIGD
jgi:hypothetical protein